jgi:hypothetical protein
VATSSAPNTASNCSESRAEPLSLRRRSGVRPRPRCSCTHGPHRRPAPAPLHDPAALAPGQRPRWCRAGTWSEVHLLGRQVVDLRERFRSRAQGIGWFPPLGGERTGCDRTRSLVPSRERATLEPSISLRERPFRAPETTDAGRQNTTGQRVVEVRLDSLPHRRKSNRPFGCFRYDGSGGTAGSSVVIGDVSEGSARGKRSIWWDSGL